MVWYAILCYAMLCYGMIWKVWKVWYAMRFQCNAMRFQCNAMRFQCYICYTIVYVVKDKHSATVSTEFLNRDFVSFLTS